MALNALFVCRSCRMQASAVSTSRLFHAAPRLLQQATTQAHPVGAYYENIVNYKTPFVSNGKPNQPPVTATTVQSTGHTFTPISPTKQPLPDSPEERAKIIFGSSLAGPAEKKEKRVAERKAKATYIAGVMIPPKPDEPDNCCMSGCVNCVWDLYREDMEEWTAANNEAQSKLKAEGAGAAVTGKALESAAANSKDGKKSPDQWQEDAFQNIPVGIREFMKQEKRLREKHEREQLTSP